MSEATEQIEKPDVACRHLHRCQHCGTIWGHGNMMAQDISAHECPNCGKTEWRIFKGLNLPTRPAAPAKARPAVNWKMILGVAMLLAALLVTYRFVRARQAAAE